MVWECESSRACERVWEWDCESVSMWECWSVQVWEWESLRMCERWVCEMWERVCVSVVVLDCSGVGVGVWPATTPPSSPAGSDYMRSSTLCSHHELQTATRGEKLRVRVCECKNMWTWVSKSFRVCECGIAGVWECGSVRMWESMSKWVWRSESFRLCNHNNSPSDIPHICHKYHKWDMWGKYFCVEKFWGSYKCISCKWVLIQLFFLCLGIILYFCLICGHHTSYLSYFWASYYYLYCFCASC